MNQKTKELVDQLKDNNEDFEFYPTSEKMLRCIGSDILKDYRDHDGVTSILDIGAGNGSALSTLMEIVENKDGYNYYTKVEGFAIEKSAILRAKIDKKIAILGTDFFEQTLVDKSANYIFCNPPYGEYEKWVDLILNTSCARVTYLVIPERWKNSKLIQQTIAEREIKFSVLANTDFLDAQRAARAVVDIVRFETGTKSGAKSAFETWFDKTFGFKDYVKTEPIPLHDQIEKEQNGSPVASQVINGKSYIEAITSLYDQEVDKYFNNYKNLCSLDAQILNGVGIDKKSIMSGIKEKMDGLKVNYWAELMKNFDPVSERVPSRKRNVITQMMNANLHVDFNTENIYAVVCWVLKTVNEGMDDHTKEMYKKLTNVENVHNYKSNLRMVNDDWRYLQDHTDYYLDYRIVYQMWGCLEVIWGEKNGEYRLSTSASELLTDLMILARNLGFRITDEAKQYTGSNSYWKPGKWNTIYFTKDDVNLVFCEIKVHKKGTFHFKFCQEFMRTLNVEAGRLFGWLKSPTQAAEEMGESVEDMDNLFVKSHHLNLGNTPLLLSEKTA